MNNILRCYNRVSSVSFPAIRNLQATRPIITSAAKFIKEIHVKELDENTITVEGHYAKSPRENWLVKYEHEDKKVCALCSLNLNLKHTDVLILSQFVRLDGCVLPKRITGLCNRQQKIVQALVAMAQKAGLMPNLTPHYSKKDPDKRYGSKKLHRYFIEDTLREYICKYPKRDESKEYPMVTSKISAFNNPRLIQKMKPN